MELFERLYIVGQLMNESRIMAKYYDINDKSRINGIITRAKNILNQVSSQSDSRLNALKRIGISEEELLQDKYCIGITKYNRIGLPEDPLLHCKDFEIAPYEKTFSYLTANKSYWLNLLTHLRGLIKVENYVATVNWMGNTDRYQFENDELYIFCDTKTNLFLKFGFRPESGKLVIASLHLNETTKVNVDYYDAVDAENNKEAEEFYLKTLAKDIEDYAANDIVHFKYSGGQHVSPTAVTLYFNLEDRNGTKLNIDGVRTYKEDILDIVDNFKYDYEQNTKLLFSSVECQEDGTIVLNTRFLGKDKRGYTKDSIGAYTCNYIRFPQKK